jgi:hypothetical protein
LVFGREEEKKNIFPKKILKASVSQHRLCPHLVDQRQKGDNKISKK